MNPSEAEQIATNPKANTAHKNREIIGGNSRDCPGLFQAD
tara:strand:- start:782 stop:901 length:120 start_codon:yes stop_codon:yes gene_type:complete